MANVIGADERLATRQVSTSTRKEKAAVALLLLAGAPFGFPVGLLLGIAGLIWLWQSPRWSVAYKLAATFVLPLVTAGIVGGLLATFASQSRECVSRGNGPFRCVTEGPAVRWEALTGTTVWAVVSIGFTVVLLAKLRTSTQASN